MLSILLKMGKVMGKVGPALNSSKSSFVQVSAVFESAKYFGDTALTNLSISAFYTWMVHVS